MRTENMWQLTADSQMTGGTIEPNRRESASHNYKSFFIVTAMRNDVVIPYEPRLLTADRVAVNCPGCFQTCCRSARSLAGSVCSIGEATSVSLTLTMEKEKAASVL